MSTVPEGFYWSPERQDCFQACLRRYYYRYYSTSEAILQVAGLRRRKEWAEGWVRRAAHAWLREVLTVEAAAARLLQSLRDDFRASRRHGYRAVPKSTEGLFEHEYGIAVPDEEWKAIADRAVADLDVFCRSAGAPEPANSQLAVGEVMRFNLLGLEVEILADAVFKDGERMCIHHWVRAGDVESRRVSRAALAWLAAVRWRAPPAAIEVIEYVFPSGPSEKVCFSEEDLEAGRELIHDAADEMRYPLADPERNIAREADFDVTDDEATCRICPFLKLCSKWQ